MSARDSLFQVDCGGEATRMRVQELEIELSEIVPGEASKD